MTMDEAIYLIKSMKYKAMPQEAEAIDMAIEALEHLDNIEAYMHDFDVTEEEATKALERKKGEWIPVTNGRGGFECSECHSYAPSYQSGDDNLSNYCPSCGADMRGDIDDKG